MKGRLFSLLIIPVLAAGCSDSANPDIAFQFRETPLRQLRGVEIGMPARQLKVSRPTARYTPYFGLQENVPGYVVSYEFKSAVGDGANSDVSGSDKLLGVYMSGLADSYESALATWRGRVVEVSKVRRAPDLCERFASGGQQARWFSGKMALVIGVFPPEPSSPIVRSRVIFGVSSIETMRQPSGAAEIPCPTT